MKKTLLILAVIVITATIFTACTNKPAETPDIADTTVDLQNIEVTVKEDVTTENIVTEQVTEKQTVAEPVITEQKPDNNIQKTEPAKPKISKNYVDNIISREEAKNIVINHAGLKEEDVKRIEIELDRERAYLVYEIDFDAGRYEYEYEINAENGNVLKHRKEFRD